MWKSDGTETGTVTVKDIHASGDLPIGLTDVDGTLFFMADDEDLLTDAVSEERRHGSPAFVFLKALCRVRLLRQLTTLAVGSTLFFAMDDDTHGEEPWKSDARSQAP